MHCLVSGESLGSAYDLARASATLLFILRRALGPRYGNVWGVPICRCKCCSGSFRYNHSMASKAVLEDFLLGVNLDPS